MVLKKEKQNYEPIIGCDVGNGFGKAAILEDPKQDPVYLLPDSLKVGMPSTAYVSQDGKIEVYGVKKTAGKWPVRAVKTRLAEETIEWTDSKGKLYRTEPSKVYAAIARDLVMLANETRKLQGKPPAYKLLLTYPAGFKDRPERLSLMKKSVESVELDGQRLQVCRMLSEPAAVAVDYAYYVRHLAQEPITSEQYTILVYDLGDGTCDVAVVTAYAKGDKDCDLICQNANLEIGGRKFDMLVCGELEKQIRLQLGENTPINREYLRSIAVEMKHELSNQMILISERDVPFGDGEAHLALTRKDFEALIMPQIRLTLGLVQSQLDEAAQKGVKVDAIVLSGGSSRIPLIKRALAELTESKLPVELYRPSVGVAYGAARAAYNCQPKPKEEDAQKDGANLDEDRKKVIAQHCERSCGIQLEGKVHFLLDETTELPCVSQKMALRSSPDGYTTFRLRRARDLMPNAKQAEYGECEDIRWLNFDLPANQNCSITMKMDENRCITLECELSDGKILRKTTFQDNGK